MEQEFELLAEVVEHLHDDGRADAAQALYKLIVHAERTGLRPPLDLDGELTEAYLDALDRGEADLAAGRIVPSEVAWQGRAAVEEYERQRDSGEIALDPHVQAAVDSFRREREAGLSTRTVDA